MANGQSDTNTRACAFIHCCNLKFFFNVTKYLLKYLNIYIFPAITNWQHRLLGVQIVYYYKIQYTNILTRQQSRVYIL